MYVKKSYKFKKSEEQLKKQSPIKTQSLVLKMNMSMKFKKFQNKILVHMKPFNVTIDHILVHFKGSKVGLYVSFRICLYVFDMYLTDDGLLFVKALFRSRLQNTSRWTTQIPRNFPTICFWWILEHCLCFLGTNFSGPFGTFLFSCVTLCYIFTFLILNSFTSYYIVINFMFMISNKRNQIIKI